MKPVNPAERRVGSEKNLFAFLFQLEAISAFRRESMVCAVMAK
jgi:hypothetical protein